MLSGLRARTLFVPLSGKLCAYRRDPLDEAAEKIFVLVTAIMIIIIMIIIIIIIVVIFKRLSLKVLSALQDHEGGQGNGVTK